MKLLKQQLRRIIRNTLIETFSDSQTIHRTSNLPRLPVDIDDSRHTHQASAFGKAQIAITELTVEEGLEVEEMRGLKSALNTLNQCMEMGDDPSQCASRIKDEAALMDVEEILFDVDETSELHQYAREVMRALGLEID